jgi:hypothetical protein
MSNVIPIRSNRALQESCELAVSYLREAMDSLTIYAAALKGSNCEIAKAVGQRLGPDHLVNDLDVAREILEKGMADRRTDGPDAEEGQS